ncbi:putative phosphoglycerol geranylgeranyltransferase [Salinarchaeum chitinilyticum]
MTAPWTEWDHILKIDPDKSLVEGETYADVCQTGTDAIEIGGTLDITSEKMSRVIEACAEYDVPLYQEPSNPAVVVDDEAVDGFLVPVVFNAGDMAWMTGFHKEWVKSQPVDWSRTTTEGYIILNPDSSVAQLTEAECDLDAEDVGAYAEIAEEMFGQDIVYVEYSGMFGDPEKVRAAADALEEATLFYGGGIHDYDSAHTMASEADVVIVGDLVHDEGVDAVRETVEAARDA